MKSLNKKDVLPLLLASVVMIAFDFFLHGGLLAKLYVKESPFLLPARQAFLRIPMGYLAFIILGGLLNWLMKSLNILNRHQGFGFGLQLGGIIWLALTLGLYSISTADWNLLLAWWLGQSLELGLAGWVLGAFYEGRKARKIIFSVMGFFFLMLALTILLQSIGWAPSMETI